MGCLSKMNLLTLFLCFLTWSACQCSPLQTEVSLMRSGGRSCVGDIVKFTCTISAISHAWRIVPLDPVTVSITLRNRTVDERFFLEVISSTNNPVMVTESRLTVTAFSGLNGQTIECFDLNGVVAERQEATAMVFDAVTPSAPELMVRAGDNLRTFDFVITPPSNSECVDEYFITIADNDGIMDSIITVPTNEIGMSPSSPPHFNLCANIYSFTIMAATSQMNGTAQSVNFPSTEGRRVSNIMVTEDNMGIEWTAPSHVPTACFPQYILNASNSSITVNGTVASFEDLNEVDFPFCDMISVVVTPIEKITGTPVGTSSATREDISVSNDICPPTTAAAPASTTGTTSTATTAITTPTTTTGGGGGGGGSSDGGSAAAVGGGVGGGLAAAGILCIIILVMAFCCYKKKKGRSDKDDDIKVISKSSKEPYHSSGAPPPQTSIPLSDAGAAGAMYASPDEIKHEAAGPTGDEYALVTSNTKKSRQPAPAADTPDMGDMYSVPDKTKKKENQGLVYADIGHQPAPKKGRMVPQQPDNEPVTYATVAV